MSHIVHMFDKLYGKKNENEDGNKDSTEEHKTKGDHDDIIQFQTSLLSNSLMDTNPKKNAKKEQTKIDAT